MLSLPGSIFSLRGLSSESPVIISQLRAGMEEGVQREFSWGVSGKNRAFQMKTTDDVNRKTADLFFGAIEKAVREKGRAIVNFPLGRTPLPIFEILVNKYGDRKDIWKKVYPRIEDEYVGLSSDDPRSWGYYLTVEPGILNRLGIPESNWQLIRANAPDLEEEIARFEEQIRATGKLDVTLNGLGPNAHLYYNEPVFLLTPEALRELVSGDARRREEILDACEIEIDLPLAQVTDGVIKIVELRGLGRITNIFLSEQLADSLGDSGLAGIRSAFDNAAVNVRIYPHPFNRARTRLLELSENTRAHFSLSPELGIIITQGLGNILEADTVILVAIGEKKAEALKATLVDPASPKAPSSGLQLHGNAVAIFDQEAARQLGERAGMEELRWNEQLSSNLGEVLPVVGFQEEANETHSRLVSP